MNKAPVVLVADVSREAIQNRFHDRSSLWLNEGKTAAVALPRHLSCVLRRTVHAREVNVSATVLVRCLTRLGHKTPRPFAAGAEGGTLAMPGADLSMRVKDKQQSIQLISQKERCVRR
jgi:hypothetical protein